MHFNALVQFFSTSKGQRSARYRPPYRSISHSLDLLLRSFFGNQRESSRSFLSLSGG